MRELELCGLLGACQEAYAGANGGEETSPFMSALMPSKFDVTLHGLQCRNECRTVKMVEDWSKDHPDWNVLFFHAKGATHPAGDPLRTNWRKCMMRNLVRNWRSCVDDLENGFDLVGCHWMSGDKTPPGQSIFAGNFWWATSDYLATRTPIMTRDRIKESGIDSLESRYEAEVWIGNGTKEPVVRDCHPEWIDQCKA